MIWSRKPIWTGMEWSTTKVCQKIMIEKAMAREIFFVANLYDISLHMVRHLCASLQNSWQSWHQRISLWRRRDRKSTISRHWLRRQFGSFRGSWGTAVALTRKPRSYRGRSERRVPRRCDESSDKHTDEKREIKLKRKIQPKVFRIGANRAGGTYSRSRYARVNARLISTRSSRP